jgi:hypothetical protein
MVASPVRQIIVSNSTAANSFSSGLLRTSATDWTFKTILQDEIYVVDRDMNIITASNGISTSTVPLYIAKGQGNGVSPLFSIPINPKEVISVGEQDYVAPIQMVKTVGYNSGTGFTTQTLATDLGKTYKFLIHIEGDFKLGTTRNITGEYAFISTVNPSSSTPYADKVAFVKQFVDAINNDSRINTFVVAALSVDGTTNVGIQVTGLAQPYVLGYPTSFVSFVMGYATSDLSYNFLDINGNTATVSQAYMGGNGTYETLSYEEWLIQSNKGVSNFTEFPFNQILVESVKGNTYTIFNITGRTRNNTGIALTQTEYSIIIAIPTTNTSLKNYLSAVLGTTVNA